MGRALYSTIYTPSSSRDSTRSSSPSVSSPSPPPMRNPVHSFPAGMRIIEDEDDDDSSRSSSPTSSIATDLDQTSDLHSLPSSVMVIDDHRNAPINPIRSSSPQSDVHMRHLGLGTWDTHKFDPDSEEFWADAEYEAVVVEGETRQPNTDANGVDVAQRVLAPLSMTVDQPPPPVVDDATSPSDGSLIPSHAPQFPTSTLTGWRQVADLPIWTRDLGTDGRAHVRAHASNPHESINGWQNWVAPTAPSSPPTLRV